VTPGPIALDLRAGRWHHGVRLLDPGSSRCRASMAVVRRWGGSVLLAGECGIAFLL